MSRLIPALLIAVLLLGIACQHLLDRNATLRAERDAAHSRLTTTLTAIGAANEISDLSDDEYLRELEHVLAGDD